MFELFRLAIPFRNFTDWWPTLVNELKKSHKRYKMKNLADYIRITCACFLIGSALVNNPADRWQHIDVGNLFSSSAMRTWRAATSICHSTCHFKRNLLKANVKFDFLLTDFFDSILECLPVGFRVQIFKVFKFAVNVLTLIVVTYCTNIQKWIHFDKSQSFKQLEF